MLWWFEESPRVAPQRMADATSGSRSSRQRFLPVLLWVAVGCYVLFATLSFLGSPVNPFDDAIPLVHGALVQQGRIPNLDFYSIYPPLGHYLHAAAFVLLGKSVISARLIGALLYMAVLFLIVVLFRDQFPRWSPLVPASILLGAVSIGASLSLASWPGFAFGLSAFLTYLVAPTLPRHRRLGIAISGFLAAAAILYRINFGGYVVMVVALDLLLRSWPEPGGRWTGVRVKSLVKCAAAFSVPFILTCLAFCLYVYGSAMGRAASEFVVGAQRLMLVRGFITLRYSLRTACFVMLPSALFFFQILWGRQTLPVKAFVAAGLAVANLSVVLAFGTRPSISYIGLLLQVASVLFLHLSIQRLETAELNILLFYCCLLHYYLSRADQPHSQWLLTVAALLLPFLLFQGQEETAGRTSESPPLMGTPFAVLVAASVIAVSAADLRPRVSYALNGMSLLSLRLHNPRVSDSDLVFDSSPKSPAWNTVYYDQNELAALRFLRASTKHDEPVYVGVGDHSRLFWNDLIIYWLADRPIGVRTFQLETRSATEATVQAGIIADLGRNGVRWLILNRLQVRGDDTFAEQAYQGSSLLDDYIRNHFRDVARFGGYSILNRIE
jgi:hypothetical protein